MSECTVKAGGTTVDSNWLTVEKRQLFHIDTDTLPQSAPKICFFYCKYRKWRRIKGNASSVGKSTPLQ